MIKAPWNITPIDSFNSKWSTKLFSFLHCWYWHKKMKIRHKPTSQERCPSRQERKCLSISLLTGNRTRRCYTCYDPYWSRSSSTRTRRLKAVVHSIRSPNVLKQADASASAVWCCRHGGRETIIRDDETRDPGRDRCRLTASSRYFCVWRSDLPPLNSIFPAKQYLTLLCQFQNELVFLRE
jgi:hypothetical protein